MKFVPSKGWGSSRSEEVTIEAYDPKHQLYQNRVVGTWTQSLSMDSKVIWKVAPLVDNPTNHCGFTLFAAQLNEITKIEQGHLPPTDSRLRPDLRSREEGRLEESEREKVRVEDGQRRRRKELEDAGEVHEPRFFQTTDAGKSWKLKAGDSSYWAEREKDFEEANLVDIFDLKNRT